MPSFLDRTLADVLMEVVDEQVVAGKLTSPSLDDSWLLTKHASLTETSSKRTKLSNSSIETLGTVQKEQPRTDLTLAAQDNGFGTGRIQMACPTNARGSVARNTNKSHNKHRRLFDGQEGALKDGEPVSYIMQGVKLLTGLVVVREKGNSGILCHHCNTVVSCSAFESHAGHGQRRNPYDGITTAQGLTLRQLAARLPSLPDQQAAPQQLSKRRLGENIGATEELAVVADRCQRLIGQLDTLASSCVLCFQTDFETDGFSDRTVIICDQCEREYHVGCLRGAERCHLQAIPEGHWFCSSHCSHINGELTSTVRAGDSHCVSDYSWQFLRGKNDGKQTAESLKQVQEILQESFDPIIDVTSHLDLLPKMVMAQSAGDFDFQGFYSILLRHQGKPVCCAIMRVLGEHLAELPLVATKADSRRQGHCRILLNSIEEKLKAMGVHVLSLPAASAAIPTWVGAFQFKPVEGPALEALQAELRLLLFPGSQLLYKVLGEEPQGGPFAFALDNQDCPIALRAKS